MENLTGLSYSSFYLGFITKPVYPEMYPGIQSEPLSLKFSSKPNESITVTFQSGGDLLFTPRSITHNATDDKPPTFTVCCDGDFEGSSAIVEYIYSGPDQYKYAPVENDIVTILEPAAITLPEVSLHPGETSRPVKMHLPYEAPVGVTITPSGAGLTFKPSKIKYLAGSKLPPIFTITCSPKAELGQHKIKFELEGADAGVFKAPDGVVTIVSRFNTEYFERMPLSDSQTIETMLGILRNTSHSCVDPMPGDSDSIETDVQVLVALFNECKGYRGFQEYTRRFNDANQSFRSLSDLLKSIRDSHDGPIAVST